MSSTFICPGCSAQLERTEADHGVFWRCPNCGGRAEGLGLLRRSLGQGLVTRLSLAAHDGTRVRRRPCPVCHTPMVEVALSGERIPTVDVCTVCELVWFDPQEYEALPTTSASTEPPLPLEARKILAMAQVKSIEEHARQTGGSEPPEEWWKYVAGLFGLPVVADAEMLHRPPWTTWAVAAFLCLVGAVTFFHVEYWTSTFGLIPAQVGRYGGLTLLTYSALHAGIFHLAGNVYFLLIFGDNVEDALGVGRYLLLLFFAAVASGVVHVLGDPRPAVPLVGASGAISGIVAFYAFRFPRVRLQFMFGSLLLGFFRWFRLPVYVFFILWVLAQFAGAWEQLTGYSSVSALGHLGGTAIGVLFYLEKRFVADDGGREDSVSDP